MDVRSAEREDVPAIQEVARQSWETDYPDVLSRETIDEGVSEWYSSERLEEQLADEDALLLVAEDDDHVVGFSHAAWEADSGDILRLYVRPDRRREGIGSQLLKRTIDGLSQRTVERIKAMALTANDPGDEFYRSMGFLPSETAQTEIGDESYEEVVYIRERAQ